MSCRSVVIGMLFILLVLAVSFALSEFIQWTLKRLGA